MAKKIRVEADRCAPKPALAPGMTRTNHRGQKSAKSAAPGAAARKTRASVRTRAAKSLPRLA